MRYTSFDKDLISHIYLELGDNSTDGASSSGRAKIDFQFPPKITSDSRSATWDESGIVGREPIANIVTPGPRVLSMNFSYLVEAIGNERTNQISRAGDPINGNNVWTIQRIRTQLNRLRGYFLGNNDSTYSPWVIKLKYDWITGRGGEFDYLTFRMSDVNVKYSDTLVGNREYGYFPKSCDVTIDLKMWTKGGKESNDSNDDNDNVVQRVNGLRKLPQAVYGNADGNLELWY